MFTKRIVAGVLAGTALAAMSGCSASTPSAHVQTASAVAASVPSQEALNPLLQQALPNAKGKTFTAAEVDFPPAARSVPHRHGDAFLYAYVLQGSVRSRLQGQPTHTYHKGQYWVEPPGANHVLAENTSRTQPAKLLVIFVSDTGAPLKVDDPHS